VVLPERRLLLFFEPYFARGRSLGKRYNSDMKAGLAEKNLSVLASKGHFLKGPCCTAISLSGPSTKHLLALPGSSAALGLVKVQSRCEALQNFGNQKQADGKGPLLEASEALDKCSEALVELEKESHEVNH
jgi:HPt (histidine-containing phosphotransfer) domain-containing protein